MIMRILVYCGKSNCKECALMINLGFVDNQLSRVKDLPTKKKKEIEKTLSMSNENEKTSWKQLAKELGMYLKLTCKGIWYVSLNSLVKELGIYH